jgi:hypothetical protein
VWNYSTRAAAHELVTGAREVCTCCRAAFAGSQLDRFRSIPKPLDADSFQAMLQLARARVETPAFYRSLSSHDFFDALIAYASSTELPSIDVARTWEVVGRKPVRVTGTVPAYVFKVRRRPDYLFVKVGEDKKPLFGRAAPGRPIAGPVAISAWKPALPVPDPTAVAKHVDKEPIMGRSRQRFTLLFRVPDPDPSSLNIGTYADLLLPIMGNR